MSLFDSNGFKRFVSSALSVVATVAGVIPVVGPAIAAVVQPAAGVIGAVGAAHGAASGTLGDHKLATITSVLAVLLTTAMHIPALAPYVAILSTLATIFGSATVGNKLAKE